MGDNDFEIVLDGRKSLARICAERPSDHQLVWGWSVYGFNHPGINGSCSTFEEAKVETKTQILRLLEANTPLMPEPLDWRLGAASKSS